MFPSHDPRTLRREIQRLLFPRKRRERSIDIRKRVPVMKKLLTLKEWDNIYNTILDMGEVPAYKTYEEYVEANK